MHKFHRYVFLQLLTAFLFMSVFTTHAYAQGWEQYKDEDGIFHVLIPGNYKINKKYLRIDDREVATSGEIISTVDQRPYKDVVKQYIVKYEQTFAHSIADNDVGSLLELELGKYIDYYTSFGGVMRNKEMGTFNGRPGGEVVISYKDKELGLQSIRVRIIYANTTKIEQIVMGPEETMFAFRTKDFFSSLQIKDGRTSLDGEFQKEWETVTSPFQLISQLIPRRNPPFVAKTESFVNSDSIERMSVKIVDPVYGHTLFYNLYGYRFNSLMTSENVQRVLMDKHLKKFNVSIAELKFAVSSKGQYPVLSTKMHFKPPSKFPFMNTIKLHAHYFGNFLVVQELAGSNIHVESVLAQNLSRYFRFDPVRGNKLLQKERAEKQMEKLENQSSAASNQDNES